MLGVLKVAYCHGKIGHDTITHHVTTLKLPRLLARAVAAACETCTYSRQSSSYGPV